MPDVEYTDDSRTTVFDDVFRTIMEKLPHLVIPLINEVFHQSYPQDVKIIQLRNEYHMKDDKIITDSFFRIGDKFYHIECQSTDDTTMALRMVEYDFMIAVRSAQKTGRKYRMIFPESCVLYLRSKKTTPDYLEVEVVFSDGGTHTYRVPTVKVSRYTKDEIFQKNLLMLLPFYIMKYEEAAKRPKIALAELNDMLSEYEDIRSRLEKQLEGDESGAYNDLRAMISKISEYIFRSNEDVKERIGDTMGGKLLDLPSDKLRAAQTEGESRLIRLLTTLRSMGRTREADLVLQDAQLRQKLYAELSI